MTYHTLEIIQHGPSATIWLNRPDVRNAFNETSIAEITQAFRVLDQDR
ncbi:MAG: enoyl-CoA hydratase/isomerase family protein, partial [Betaproteobacteria bacterium]|nr:enoyl-CoA hydratase/isomerase family protein [Betaproteobacteria bacterium]